MTQDVRDHKVVVLYLLCLVLELISAMSSNNGPRRQRCCNNNIGHGWSHLPYDLLHTVMSRMRGVGDSLRLRIVCRWWRFASEGDALPQQPLLMLPSEGNFNTRRFYDYVDRSEHRVGISELRGMRTYGSSQGWLFAADRYSGVKLINPWSKEVVLDLPPLLGLRVRWPRERDWLVCKAIPSVAPSSSEDGDQSCVVAVIDERRQLAFAKLNDKVWKRPVAVESNPHLGQLKFDDVANCRKFFFAISIHSHIVAFRYDVEVDYYLPIPMVILSESIGEHINLNEWRKYLVYKEKSLWAVLRKIEVLRGRGGHNTYYRTKMFRVFKLYYNLQRGLYVEEVKSLDGHAFFLGLNASIALPASAGCRSNCIYFTDDFLVEQFWVGRNLTARRGDDVGVYNMEDGAVHGFGRDFPKTVSCPPIWVTPSTIG